MHPHHSSPQVCRCKIHVTCPPHWMSSSHAHSTISTPTRLPPAQQRDINQLYNVSIHTRSRCRWSVFQRHHHYHMDEGPIHEERRWRCAAPKPKLGPFQGVCIPYSPPKISNRSGLLAIAVGVVMVVSAVPSVQFDLNSEVVCSMSLSSYHNHDHHPNPNPRLYHNPCHNQ